MDKFNSKNEPGEKYKFIKYTLLHVMLWIGIWGLSTIIIHKYLPEYEHQTILYVIMIVLSIELIANDGLYRLG